MVELNLLEEYLNTSMLLTTFTSTCVNIMPKIRIMLDMGLDNTNVSYVCG